MNDTMDMTDKITLQDEFLTVEEVAAKMRVTVQTVRALCDKGEIPGAFKIGRQWRIPFSKLVKQPA